MWLPGERRAQHGTKVRPLETRRMSWMIGRMSWSPAQLNFLATGHFRWVANRRAANKPLATIKHILWTLATFTLERSGT